MTTVIDWNKWREDYDTMTYGELREFNQTASALYPEQRHWNGGACARFIEAVEAKHVAELGGWDGALADEMLGIFPSIESWTNYDITRIPQVCEDERFTFEHLFLPAEVLAPGHSHAMVASHVFEHMRIAEVERIIASWNPDHIKRIKALGYKLTHSEGQFIAFLSRS